AAPAAGAAGRLAGAPGARGGARRPPGVAAPEPERILRPPSDDAALVIEVLPRPAAISLAQVTCQLGVRERVDVADLDAARAGARRRVARARLVAVTALAGHAADQRRSE